MRDATLAVRTAEATLSNRRAELDSSLLATEATVAQIESDAREARLNADADQQLRDHGLTSAITSRTKKARADNLEHRLTLERERLDLQRRSLASQLAIQEADVERQRAALRQTELLRDGLQVRAGVSGVLQQVAVELGARVGPGANLARVVDPARLKAELLGEEGGTIQLFRLDATGHALRVPVTLGRMSANAVEIRAGLTPGDQVILSDMSQWEGVERVRVK